MWQNKHMEQSDEKYFEELAMGAAPVEETPSDEPFHIELAKASTAQAQPRLSVKKSVADELKNEAEGTLTIDVYQTPNDIVVESAIAGVKPEDLDVTATADSVVIKGQRHHERAIKDEDYLYQECYWGKFSRSVILPQEVDPENAAVTFKNGILIVRLPKLNRQRSKKLRVKLD
jgi:HSP20 family protein